MQKESIKFDKSCVFEGMTSIRAVIRGIDSGVSDRKIETIYYDVDKMSKIAKVQWSEGCKIDYDNEVLSEETDSCISCKCIIREKRRVKFSNRKIIQPIFLR